MQVCSCIVAKNVASLLGPLTKNFVKLVRVFCMHECRKFMWHQQVCHCLTHFSWDLQGGHGTEIVTGTYHPHHIPVHIVGMPAFIANFREESEITK